MPTPPFNPGFAFLRLAEQQPEKIAIFGPHPVSYGQLRTMVILNTLHMRARGVGPGSYVVLAQRSLALGLSMVLGVALLGAKWIAGSPRVMAEENGGYSHIFHDEIGRTSPNPRLAPVDQSWTRPPAGVDMSKRIEFSGQRSADDVFVVAMSSGTTGVPKRIGWSYRNFHSYALDWATGIVGDAGVRVSLFPNLSFLKTLHALGCLLSGRSLTDGGSLSDWHRVGVGVVFASPATIGALSADWPAAGAKLPMVCLSGGVVSPAVLARLLGYFDLVRMDYGATEVGSVGVTDLRAATDDLRLLRPCLTHRHLEVVDDHGTPLPVGAEGVLRLRTPYVAGKYQDDDAASAEAFRNGAFYPGDLARAEPGGAITLLGRVKDQFNLGGVKFNASDIDAFAMAVPGVRDAVCFVQHVPDGAERLAMAVRLDDGADPAATAAAIRAAITQARSVAQAPQAIYAMSAVPRNANGKALRDTAADETRGLPPL